MRRWLALIELSTLLGCSPRADERLIGTWKFDPSTLHIPGISEAMKDSPGYQKDVAANALILNDDGTCSLTGATNLSGRWKLVGNEISITPQEAAQAKDIPAITVDPGRTRLHASLAQKGFEVDLEKAE